jgi:mannose-1-phosphate guanylyltransferase
MNERRLWAIILAGGEGSRLAETTRRMYGSRLPKQFLSFGQSRTFLQATVDRLQGLIPPERTVVVVAACHEAIAREQLAEFSGIETVAQPRNVGTGPGVLLPLLHVLARDGRADVALVPSDHDFRAPAKMRQAMLVAKRAARPGANMVLIGARAECAASDLGWIVPKQAQRRSSVKSIETFVEKPGPDVAERLFARGALWNTMLSVARGSALWRLGREHLPAQVTLLEEYARSLGSGRARECLREVYERLQPADFSRDLVAASTGLRVTAMEDAGWSDCGTPERLAAAFGATPGVVAATLRTPLAEAVRARGAVSRYAFSSRSSSSGSSSSS